MTWMGVLEIIVPVLLIVAVIAVVAVVVDRRRRTPGSTDDHDRLTDSPRPPEAYRMPGQSDEYRR
ncbi:MAG TPA: hypothetical protein VFG98_01330 [Intrasporangium sp.]|nr:hypothetical protein [Intrasporangium sp.]